MNQDLIEKVAWVGQAFVKRPIRGIVLSFAGLGGTVNQKTSAEPMEKKLAEAGALIVAPYYNPWAWMNSDTVTFVDELLDALLAAYQLDSSTPIITTGGSMGGHAALLFPLMTRHHVSRCVAISPVCDLLYHYYERSDVPRTLHDAFRSYGDIQEVLRQHSPLHQISRMPQLDYLVVHGMRDKAVAKMHHSDKFCQEMLRAGYRITYYELVKMEHCGPIDSRTLRAVGDFVTGGLLQ